MYEENRKLRQLTESEVDLVGGGVGPACLRGAQWLGRVVRDGLAFEAVKAGASGRGGGGGGYTSRDFEEELMEHQRRAGMSHPSGSKGIM